MTEEEKEAVRAELLNEMRSRGEMRVGIKTLQTVFEVQEKTESGWNSVDLYQSKLNAEEYVASISDSEMRIVERTTVDEPKILAWKAKPKDER